MGAGAILYRLVRRRRIAALRRSGAMRRLMPAAAFPLLLVIATMSALAANESPADGLRRCSREADDHRRLACFDALAKGLPALEADRFGMTAEIERKRDPAALKREHAQTLAGRIVDLRESAVDQWVFTLDNHQVWIQTEPRPNVEFAVGEPVRIEHGAFGSLWLTASKGRMVKVKRIS